ncbi:MAG: hypothetical protein ACK417_10500 [Bacteroidia bacterium]
MLNERQYYGLLSSLPAIRLEKCSDPPWQALYQLAMPLVDAYEYNLLRGLYLHNEHLPLLLGHIPAEYPYPLQHSPEQISTSNPAELPYLSKESLLQLREIPLPQALGTLARAYHRWLLSFKQSILTDYLELRNEINHYRLQWQASENADARQMLKNSPMSALSVLEQRLEQKLMPGILQQLVHSGNSRQQEWQLDQLLFEWLEQQVFHETFGLNALLSYALRQQISWKWYVSPGFNSSQKIESMLNEILA